MTQNLRLVNKTVSSDDSAMESGSFTIPASNINNFVTSEDDAPAVYYDGNTSHGAYYDWYTATAGSGTKSVTEGDVPNSICPKGWHLPLQSEYQTLYDAYPSNGLMVDANGPKYTAFGYIYNKAVQTSTYIYSYYWSSTAFIDEEIGTSYNAGALYAYTSSSSSSTSVSSSTSRYYGGLIRCVAGDISEQKRSFNIAYNANGGSYTPNSQTGITYSDSITLRGYTSRGGYEFLGWCTVNPGTSTTCSEETYKSGNSIPLNSESNDITLYAIWKQYPNISTFRCSALTTENSSNYYYYNSAYMSSPQSLVVHKYKYNNLCVLHWNHDIIVGQNNYSGAYSVCSSMGGRLPSPAEIRGIYNYNNGSEPFICWGCYASDGNGYWQNNSWATPTKAECVFPN